MRNTPTSFSRSLNQFRYRYPQCQCQFPQCAQLRIVPTDFKPANVAQGHACALSKSSLCKPLLSPKLLETFRESISHDKYTITYRS